MINFKSGMINPSIERSLKASFNKSINRCVVVYFDRGVVSGSRKTSFVSNFYFPLPEVIAVSEAKQECKNKSGEVKAENNEICFLLNFKF